MRTAVFSTKNYDRQFLQPPAATAGHELVFFEPRLDIETAPLASGFPAICTFVNDQINAAVLDRLVAGGTKFIALRCAGFNNVDLARAEQLGITVARVPAYSPHAVAEHTVALILALNRKINRAYNRVREGNFALEGLLGSDLYKKTLGIVGTGKIGALVAGIMRGFGCRVLAYDPHPNPDLHAGGIDYVPLAELLAGSDIVTLHSPLTRETRHMIDTAAVHRMKRGVMLINTSRGELIDTRAVITALKSGHIGYLGLDVYEEEEELFFEDLSHQPIQDDVFSRLLTFPNVLVTAHQAFFTQEALENIAETTLANIAAFEMGTRGRGNPVGRNAAES